jgi:nitroreductase
MTLRKPAETSVPVHEHIRDRWSPRAFLDRPVPRDLLVSLFEAARWAPSCNNSQPWRYIVATSDNRDAYETAQACVNERNQRWSRLAPVLCFVCASKNLADGRPSPTHMYDTGMASAQLIVQATAHGLVIHQMAGILRDKIRETYSVPDDTDIICGLALGYQGDASLLPDELSERELQPRRRQALTDFVFTGKFGEAASIFT